MKKVIDFIKENSLLDKKNILVAVSGGVDSIALLHFLLSLKDKENLNLAALHFEHGIRGEESKEDAAFVQSYCESNNVRCFMGEGNVPKYAKEHKITAEMAARILRYAFFEEILQREHFDVIATAHHADDQAETVILNLLRGSGIKGLAAMRPARDYIIRPFLCVAKTEILEYAKKNNLEYREDSTNNSNEYRRNRIRHELLPLLETYQAGVKERLTTLAEIARDENDYIESIAKSKIHLLQAENSEKFKLEPPAMERRIILSFLEEKNIATDFTHIEEIRKILVKGEKGKRVEISGDTFAEFSYSGLQIIREENIPSEKILKIPGENILEDFHIKIIVKILDKIPAKTRPNEYYADLDKISGKIGVRAKADGDKIELAFGKKSVKKIFMEEKIDRSRRNKYPMIFFGTNVLWIPLLRRSVFGKPTKTTKRILYMKVEEI